MQLKDTAAEHGRVGRVRRPRFLAAGPGGSRRPTVGSFGDVAAARVVRDSSIQVYANEILFSNPNRQDRAGTKAAQQSNGSGVGGGITTHQEGTMSRFQQILIASAALLVLGVSDRAAAQQEPDVTAQTQTQQRQGAGDPASGQGAAAQAREGHTRQLGPGDGTGNQGVKPSDGSGFGSPGRLGSGTDQGSKSAQGARKSDGNGSSKSRGPGASSRQKGSRQVAGGGPGGSLCDGSRRHSGLGGGGSSRRGGGSSRR
jgi:hypothetical protein